MWHHLSDLAASGTRAVIVCPIGFVADHIEVIWDLDGELAEQADELGIALARATTPNAQPRFAELALGLLDEGAPVEPARVIGAEPVPGYGSVSTGDSAPPTARRAPLRLRLRRPAPGVRAANRARPSTESR